MYIEHSAKGTHWTKKKHKYINKIGGRYVYPSERERQIKRDYAEDKVWKNVHTATDQELNKLVNERHRRNDKYYEAKGVESRKQMEDPKMFQNRDKQVIGKWKMDRMSYDGGDSVFDSAREASINNNAKHLGKAINKAAKGKDLDNDDKAAKKLSKISKRYNTKYGKDSYKDQTGKVKLKPMKVKSKGQKAVESILEKIKSGSSNKNLKQLKKDRKNGLLGTREYRSYYEDGRPIGSRKLYVYDTEKHAAKATRGKNGKSVMDVTYNEIDKINDPMGKHASKEHGYESSISRNKRPGPIKSKLKDWEYSQSHTDNPYEYYNRKAKSPNRSLAGYRPLDRIE